MKYEDLRYRIVGRTFDGGEVVGYTLLSLYDNSTYWFLPSNVIDIARNGYIENVKVSGGKLCGINGFKLKELPSQKFSSMPTDLEDISKLHELMAKYYPD